MEKITNEDAQQMFNMCAYFAPDKIPVDMFIRAGKEVLHSNNDFEVETNLKEYNSSNEILNKSYKDFNFEFCEDDLLGRCDILPKMLARSIVDPLLRNTILKDLTRYSLLSWERSKVGVFEDNRTLSMHRLLQDVVRKSLNLDTSWMLYSMYLIYKLKSSWKEGDKSSIDLFNIELPHAISIAENVFNLIKNDKFCNADLFTGALYRKMGIKGPFDESFESSQKAALVGFVYESIARCYKILGNNVLALKYYIKQLDIHKNVFPTNSYIYIEMGSLYDSLGENEKSMDLHNELRDYLDDRGENDAPDTHLAMSGSFLSAGDYDNAIICLNKAIELFESKHRLPSIKPWQFLCNVSEIYLGLGDNHNAIKYLEKTEVFVGENTDLDSIEIARAQCAVGFLYAIISNFDKAFSYLFNGLDIITKNLPNEHEVTALAMSFIGRAYRIKKEYERAIEYLTHAVKIFKSIYGDESLRAAEQLHEMGRIYVDMECYAKSLISFKDCIKVNIKNFGEENHNTAILYMDIGRAYALLGEYEKAINYFSDARRVFIIVHGEIHHTVLDAERNIEVATKGIDLQSYHQKNTSIKYCSECGKETYDYVDMCQGCGSLTFQNTKITVEQKEKTKKNNIVYSIIVVLVLFILLYFFIR
jgi:tetratricopeptide (TPR) repeat protein